MIESCCDGLLGTSRKPSPVWPNLLGINALPRRGEKFARFRSWLSWLSVLNRDSWLSCMPLIALNWWDAFASWVIEIVKMTSVTPIVRMMVLAFLFLGTQLAAMQPAPNKKDQDWNNIFDRISVVRAASARKPAEIKLILLMIWSMLFCLLGVDVKLSCLTLIMSKG